MECFDKRRTWEYNHMGLFIRKSREFCFLTLIKNQRTGDGVFRHNPRPLLASKLLSVLFLRIPLLVPLSCYFLLICFQASLCCLYFLTHLCEGNDCPVLVEARIITAPWPHKAAQWLFTTVLRLTSERFNPNDNFMKPLCKQFAQLTTFLP